MQIPNLISKSLNSQIQCFNNSVNKLLKIKFKHFLDLCKLMHLKNIAKFSLTLVPNVYTLLSIIKSIIIVYK